LDGEAAWLLAHCSGLFTQHRLGLGCCAFVCMKAGENGEFYCQFLGLPLEPISGKQHSR
jgi:hypothetical protein